MKFFKSITLKALSLTLLFPAYALYGMAEVEYPFPMDNNTVNVQPVKQYRSALDRFCYSISGINAFRPQVITPVSTQIETSVTPEVQTNKTITPVVAPKGMTAGSVMGYLGNKLHTVNGFVRSLSMPAWMKNSTDTLNHYKTVGMTYVSAPENRTKVLVGGAVATAAVIGFSGWFLKKKMATKKAKVIAPVKPVVAIESHAPALTEVVVTREAVPTTPLMTEFSAGESTQAESVVGKLVDGVQTAVALVEQQVTGSEQPVLAPVKPVENIAVNQAADIINSSMSEQDKIAALQPVVAAFGFDVNASVDVHGNKLLHIAALKNNFEVVKLLVAKGARFDVTNNAGRYAVQVAVSNGCYKMAAHLTNLNVEHLRKTRLAA